MSFYFLFFIYYFFAANLYFKDHKRRVWPVNCDIDTAFVITELENIGSRIDMQTHAGNGRTYHSGVYVYRVRNTGHSH